jgi:hypothetical protein
MVQNENSKISGSNALIKFNNSPCGLERHPYQINLKNG